MERPAAPSGPQRELFAPQLSLEAAIQALRAAPDGSQEQLELRLRAIQAACSGLVNLVNGGGRLPLDLLQGALEAVAAGLAAARQQLEAAAGQLAALRVAAWSEALLAAADACLLGEAWHAAWHDGPEAGAGDQAGAGRRGYKRSVDLLRGCLKDDLLPLLCGAAAQLRGGAGGFCLAHQFRALLDMGRAAAEIVGMRDPRHRRPGLRNFSVLNVLWNGIQRLWTAVPPEARSDLERAGLGASEVVGAVLAAARRDARTCRQLLDPGVGKLLVYWLQKARFVIDGYPGAGTAAWTPLLELDLQLQAELAALAPAAAAGATSGGDGGGSSAQQLAAMLADKVLPNATATLAAALAGATSEDQLRVMVDELRMRLSGEPSPAAAHALRAALPLLQGGARLPPLVRLHCVRLLDAVLDSLAGAACAPALQCGQLREAVGDAALAFLAACCHADATAAGSAELQAGQRKVLADTWERCQRCLLQHALHPHPLTASVLGGVWGDLAACASEALLKAHAAALRDLLRCTMAAAAAGGHGPPSPLQAQLLGLLGCVLCAVPAPTLHAYFANFLQVLPAARDDACQLACLSAELRLAALVDGATGGTAAAPQVHAVLRALYDRLIEAAPQLLSRAAASGAGGAAPAEDDTAASSDAEAATLYLAWLLDAVQASVAYIAATGAHKDDTAPILAALPSRLAALLVRMAAKGLFVAAAPALGALRNLDTCLLRPEELASLAPALAACQQHPELAGAVAGVAPALARCPSPHAEVVQAALAAPGPLAQHLGVEAFRAYAQACPAAALMQALPPSMLNPGTGGMLEACAVVLQQYSERRHGGDPAASEQELAAWAAALRGEARDAAAALRRAVHAARAAAEAEAAAPPCGGAPADCGGVGGSAVAAAVQQMLQGVQAAEAALQAGPLDPGAAQALRECSARLAALLGGAVPA